MNKINVHKMATDLAQATNETLNLVRRARQQIQGQVSHLREVEDKIRANLRMEQEKARLEAEAQQAQAAPSEAEAADQPQAAQSSAPEAPVEAASAPAAQERPARSVRGEERPINRTPREGRPVRPAGGGYAARDGERRPAREGGYAPRDGERRPAGGGYANRAPGQGRPAGGGYANRAPGQGRPAGGGYANRAPGQGRPAGGPNRGPGQGRPAGGLNSRTLARELAPTEEQARVSNYDPRKNQYSRDRDQDKNKRGRRAPIREQGVVVGDDEWRRRGKRRKNQSAPAIERKIIDHAVITGETVTIKDLAEKIGKPGSEIIKKLLLLGIFANINQEIDFDTASLVATDFGVTLEQQLEKSYEEVMIDAYDEQEGDEEGEIIRPPVVTIMGHVDHGKTSVLDKIRNTHVTSTEAGGITQHIGAYSIDVNGKGITFVDTPGHAAFTAMRARGAQVTDIAILIVAADDGVMPQTVEAINHIKAAEVPMIVAINKCDLPNANPDRVLQELTQYNVLAEEWGGDTICVRVSAHTGEGLDQLLEMILLQAEILELKANPNHRAKGTVVEAKLDKGRGPVATILIKDGTLHVGDSVVAGSASGRVRAMLNDRGERVAEAGPSMPVEVVGFSDVPEAGDTLYAVEDAALSKRVAEERREKQKAEQLRASARVTLEDLFSKISEGEIKELNIIIKADVQGSAEAVRQAMEKLSNENVRVVIIHCAVGAITEYDVMLAAASNAIIIGFNIRPDANGRAAAEREKVDVRSYRVIYDAIEDVEKAMKGMLDPTFKEVILGHAEVREVFSISSVGTVAGLYVTDGKLSRNAQIRLTRDSVVIHEGVLSSLKRFKDDVREVNQGYECGGQLEGYNDIKVGDQLEAFQMEEIKQD